MKEHRITKRLKSEITKLVIGGDTETINRLIKILGENYRSVKTQEEKKKVRRALIALVRAKKMAASSKN